MMMKTMPWPFRAAAAFCAALLLLAGAGPLCAQDDGDMRPFGETRPLPEARDELSIAWSAADIELDVRKAYLANEAQLFTGPYEGLFSYHPLTMEPRPAAAESWDLSKDKKTWTFTLRADGRFSNGDPVRAEDFRAAWLSLIEPGRESPYSSLFDIIEGAREYRLGRGAGPRSVAIRAPDDRTLEVTLVSPAAFFPSMLCHHSFSPLHPSMLAADADWTRPVGNGPFIIREARDDRIILEKNPEYWDSDQVKLNRIILRSVEDEDDAALLWNTGKARWIAGNVNIDALSDISGIQVNAMFATHYFYIRADTPPWNDQRVRRALTLVLPWDEIRRPYALPAKTLVYPIPGYPHVEGLSLTDVPEAERLLAEAGYAGGAGLPRLVIRTAAAKESERICGLMAEAWRALGLDVFVDARPVHDYFSSLKQGGYQAASSTWIGDFADPYTFLQMWRRDSNLNDALYSDDDYEALMDRSMAEEGETRWATLAEAEKLLLERGAVLPISYSPALNIISTSEIGGWYKNVLDLHPFKYLEFRSFRPLPGVALGGGE
jgi:peptide/nickel transport system substrate-binding protein/oligopeptide transport system substrate-binding protein